MSGIADSARVAEVETGSDKAREQAGKMQNLQATEGEAAEAVALRTQCWRQILRQRGSASRSKLLLATAEAGSEVALGALEGEAARIHSSKSHHSKHFAKNCAGEVNEVRLIKNCSCCTAQSPAATLQQGAQRREIGTQLCGAAQALRETREAGGSLHMFGTK